jgi:prepilin-type N-terminal cleavage/methylation domain-containing protein
MSKGLKPRSKTISRNRGFTIIELMFAVALLGFILIFSLTVISQLISTYNRGLSLIQVNQAIRQLDNDLGKALRFVGPGSVTVNFFDARGEVLNDPSDDKVVAGSFCMKDATYIWNLGNKTVDGNQPFFHYTNSTTPLRLLRINTNDNKYCAGTTRALKRGDAELDVVSLLGSQSMVMYADIETVGLSSTDQRRLLRVHFILSSAGADYSPMWANEKGEEKPDSAAVDPTIYHLTCVNTKNKSEFCSFGEFNSIIYMRGQ